MYRHHSSAHGSLRSSLARALSSHRDPKLTFICNELGGLQSLRPAAVIPPSEPGRARNPWTAPRDGAEDGGREISHPWPEWTALMERLLEKGYLDRSGVRANSSKASNLIRTACLNFARDRFELIRYLSRRDIQIIVGSGCPSLDRKVVNSGKRLRAYVGIEEGCVCSSCNLRGNCERAYVKAYGDEGARTLDIMRLLLTYGLELLTGAVENQACMHNSVNKSVRRLLKEMVEFSAKEQLDSCSPTVISGRPLFSLGSSNAQQLRRAKTEVPMKQGDWICPKCNFLNFAKNLKCLRCDGEFQERLKILRKEHEHLPLKKGDWICEKCNFLNFAKNTKCLQCNEKPLKRQLNPGEWECVSCNYVNFQKNMVCLKCDWKRPKALVTGNVPRSEHGNEAHSRHPTITSIRKEHNTNMRQFLRHRSSMQEEDKDFWIDGEDGADDLGALNRILRFDDFPIAGGKSTISRDPRARERWKMERLKRSRVFSGERTNETDSNFGFASFMKKTEMGGCSSEDENMAEWFTYESSEDGEKLEGCEQ